MGVDYSSLPKATKKLLEEVEANSPAQQQINAITGLATLTQGLLDSIQTFHGDSIELSRDTVKELRQVEKTLSKLDKEPEKFPDVTSPIVAALKKLHEAVTAIDVAPVVEAPNVNVDVPEVDLSGVEKIIQEDIPAAFETALGKIVIPITPETDLSPVVEQLSGVQDWLKSIDTATRLKPQFPDVMKVTNNAGVALDVTSPVYATKVTVSSGITYVGEALPGTAAATAGWRIQRIDGNGNITWKDGDAGFDNTATDLTAGSFS